MMDVIGKRLRFAFKTITDRYSHKFFVYTDEQQGSYTATGNGIPVGIVIRLPFDVDRGDRGAVLTAGFANQHFYSKCYPKRPRVRMEGIFRHSITEYRDNNNKKSAK